METPQPPGREVLLLGGEGRDAWEQALRGAGFQVRTTGWLDAVTAVRLRRPDAVVVADDLPAGAAELLARAFLAMELWEVPLLACCPPSLELELAFPRAPPRRFLSAPVDPATVPGLVSSLLEEAAHPRRQSPWLLTFIAFAAFVAAGAALTLGKSPSTVREWFVAVGQAAAFGCFTGFLAQAIVVPRPLRLAAVRTVCGWASVLVWQCMPRAGPRAFFAAITFASLSGSVWAGLSLRVKPRTPGWRAWFVVLAVAFAALAILPWVLFAGVVSDPAAG
jgi:hypothetical protein